MPEFQFDSFADFLSMGGYGLYVWLAYAAFVVFLLLNILPPLLARKGIVKAGKRLAELERIQSESDPSQPHRNDS